MNHSTSQGKLNMSDFLELAIVLITDKESENSLLGYLKRNGWKFELRISFKINSDEIVKNPGCE